MDTLLANGEAAPEVCFFRNRESEQAGGADPLTSGVHCRRRPRSRPRVHRSARVPAQPGHIWVLEGKPETAVLEIFWAQRAQRQGLTPSADQGGGPSPPPATWSTGRAEARRLGQGKGLLGPAEAGAGVLTGVGAQQKPASSCLDISTVGYPGILGGMHIERTLQEAETPNKGGARAHHRFYETCDTNQPRAPFVPTAGKAWGCISSTSRCFQHIQPKEYLWSPSNRVTSNSSLVNTQGN